MSIGLSLSVCEQLQSGHLFFVFAKCSTGVNGLFHSKGDSG